MAYRLSAFGCTRVAAGWFGRLILLSSLWLLSACAAHGSSMLEKGERLETGRRLFDSYFAAVADLRDAVGEIDSDLFPVRQPLTEELDTDVDITLPALLDETRRRASKLRDFGVTASLRLTPHPRMLIETGQMAADDKQEGLLKAIEESANRAMTTFKQYSELLDKAAELDAKRGELAEQIDRLPPTFDKKAMVEDEIVGAGRVLAKINERLLADTRTLGLLIVGLVAAVDTGAAESFDNKCAEAMAAYEPKKKRRPRRTGRGGRRHGGRPHTARPPPPPSGGDFEM